MSTFLSASVERAVKTFVQTLLSALGIDYVTLVSLDWQHQLGLALTAAIASMVSSVLSRRFGPVGSPSLVADPAAAQDSYLR